ncbi:MAG: hypothetical protein WD738_24030 [Pirellulales bacterium]
MHSQSLAHVGLLLLSLLIRPVAIRAADVQQNVPADALGFVVVKNLAATDAKVQQLLKRIEAPLPGPLAFVKAATGVSAGLDPQGDLLFVVLPGAAADKPQFAIWLPVRDYDQLMASLGGASGQEIAAVTVAGEDVLVAHDGRWALMMDPEQRELMQRTLAADPNPPPVIAQWNNWIDANDISVVALPQGVRATLAWAASIEPAAQRAPAQENEVDIFNFGEAEQPEDPFAAALNDQGTNQAAATWRATIRKWTTASPLTRLLLHARLVGCALRLDENGNVQAALRLNGLEARLWGDIGGEHEKRPPALYQGGNFVLHGAGNLPLPLTSLLADAYVRSVIEDLKTEERMELREASVTQFREAIQRATADVDSAVVLTQPGDKQAGVYTNDFLVVRASPAGTFAENAKEVMRLWNSMNRDAQTQTRLVFDVEEVKVGNRTATQYSLDIAAADGAPDLPEIRQAMEKLFGPGGKLRLWIVPVDDETVLLATATPEQVAAALEVLDRKQSIVWSDSELASTYRLLPDDADWRLFFSPHHYNNWHRRQMDAITGPVIGSPLVKEFPSSPPIGFAGGLRNHELWIDAAVPAETLKGAGAYLRK